MIVEKTDGAKITFLRVTKKMLSLHRQTIKHEPAYYIFNNALAIFLCGHLHLLRQRKGLRNGSILLWLTVLQQQLEHLAERGSDGGEISVNFTLRIL